MYISTAWKPNVHPKDNNMTQSSFNRDKSRNLGVERMEWPAGRPNPWRTQGSAGPAVRAWVTNTTMLTDLGQLLVECLALAKTAFGKKTYYKAQCQKALFQQRNNLANTSCLTFCTKFTQWMRVKMELTKDPQASLHLRKRRSQLWNSFDGATKPQTQIGPQRCQTRFQNYAQSSQNIN